MKITLHGAAGEVTGSAYLIQTDRARVLLDFGMFQGGARAEEKNCVPEGLDPKRLDAVLLTHAHLDHVGRLPLLLKDGFQGPIYATDATRDLAGLILHDSAKVQQYDIERTNRKRQRAGETPLEPLYHHDEVDRTLALFRLIEYEQPRPVVEGVTARFVEAGHMLGSASIQLTIEENGRTKRVVFSGDLGPHGLALVRDPVPLRQADLVFLESTYGDRDHKPPKETLAEFSDLIQEAVGRRARILVPAFAVGRTQQILFHLEELFCAGTVKPFPVYLDSPMAVAATRIYEQHPDLFDEEALDLERRCGTLRQNPHVRTTETPAESMALNDASGPCLIMAGAGMCNAGRILHHLRHGLWRPETVVLIVGYQAEGSLGRLLVDGAKQVSIFGEKIAVKAAIHTLNGFSAHAGQSELLGWFDHLAPSKPRVVLTHGEPRGREPLAALIEERHGLKPQLPAQGDVIEL
jgi:metallo-beta-lactamase family protein